MGNLKRKSAARLKQEYPEWRELIQIAEEWHYDLEMEQKEQTLKFLKFVIEKVNSHDDL